LVYNDRRFRDYLFHIIRVPPDRLSGSPKRFHDCPCTCLEGLWRTAKKRKVLGRESNQEAPKYDAQAETARKDDISSHMSFEVLKFSGRWLYTRRLLYFGMWPRID
jgi:hypothetical protein